MGLMEMDVDITVLVERMKIVIHLLENVIANLGSREKNVSKVRIILPFNI